MGALPMLFRLCPQLWPSRKGSRQEREATHLFASPFASGERAVKEGPVLILLLFLNLLLGTADVLPAVPATLGKNYGVWGHCRCSFGCAPSCGRQGRGAVKKERRRIFLRRRLPAGRGPSRKGSRQEREAERLFAPPFASGERAVKEGPRGGAVKKERRNVFLFRRLPAGRGP